MFRIGFKTDVAIRRVQPYQYNGRMFTREYEGMVTQYTTTGKQKGVLLTGIKRVSRQAAALDAKVMSRQIIKGEGYEPGMEF